MAKEEIDESLAPVRARKAKKQAELEIAKMDEKKMASQESAINEMCCQIDFNAIIKAQDGYCLMEQKRKKQFIKIIEEMFQRISISPCQLSTVRLAGIS